MHPHILEILASKICHDLISPIGAINNGIEFMQDMGADGIDDAAELISYSATKATSKLQAYRMAYGAGGADSIHTPATVYEFTQEIIGDDGKIKLVWNASDEIIAMNNEGSYPKGFCKTLMSLMLLLTDSLPRGGEIHVKKSEFSSNSSRIIIIGRGAALKDGQKEALHLQTDENALNTNVIHPYVCALLAKRYGLDVKLEDQKMDEVQNELTFSITALT